MLELHISKIPHHSIPKSSIRRQHEAVKNEWVLEPERSWLKIKKTWLLRVKELGDHRQDT